MEPPSSAGENIRVYGRWRPLGERERQAAPAWETHDATRIIKAGPGLGAAAATGFTLDAVFKGELSTADVYSATVQDKLLDVVEGKNVTVFAYGQTASGKTFTMSGSAEEPGIIPLAVGDVFTLIEQRPDREFVVRMSYYEIYNEDVFDLMVPVKRKADREALKVRGDGRKQPFYVPGLREQAVSSVQQVVAQLATCSQNRSVGGTRMNEESSRSHAVLHLHVAWHTRGAAAEGREAVIATLTLVDLAGSERRDKTGAEGQRAKEGAAINTSLLALGTVINKLTEGVEAKGGHVPYRDSTLTKILQPSLGGNAKTAIICTLNSSAAHADETKRTLEFACRAKKVVNHAEVNVVRSDAAALQQQAEQLEQQAGELQGLRRTVAQQRQAMEQQAGEVEGLRRTVAQQRQAMEEQAVQLKQQAEQLEQQRQRMEEQEGQLAQQQQGMEQQAGEVEELRRTVAQQRQRMEEQEGQLEQQAQAIGDRQRDMDEQQRTLERTRCLEVDVAQLRSAKERLETTQVEHSEHSTALEQQIRAMAAEAAEWKGQLTAAEREAQAAAELKGQLAAAEQEAQALRAELARQQQEAQALEARHKQALKEVQHAQHTQAGQLAGSVDVAELAVYESGDANLAADEQPVAADEPSFAEGEPVSNEGGEAWLRQQVERLQEQNKQLQAEAYEQERLKEAALEDVRYGKKELAKARKEVKAAKAHPSAEELAALQAKNERLHQKVKSQNKTITELKEIENERNLPASFIKEVSVNGKRKLPPQANLEVKAKKGRQ